MKLYIVTLIMCFALTSYAQAPVNQIEVGIGASLKAGAIRTVLNQKKDVNVGGTTVIMASYERRFAPAFALGASYTKQSLTGFYNFTTEVDNREVNEALSFDYSRISFVLEPKVYYPIKIENWEFYSSFRLGFKKEKLDAYTTNNTLNEILKLTDLLVGNPINLSLTPLGINFFPNKHLGLGVAGNLGPTYFTKASVFIRF